MARRNEITTQVHTAQAGVAKRGLTCLKSREPGGPPSRAKANNIREFEVTDDNPQNHMAPITIQPSASAIRPPSAVESTYKNGFSAAAVFGRSPMARVIAISMIQP